MKTLKVGFDIKSWRYKIVCDYCKSELEVEAKDLKYAGEDGDWHDAGWESYSFSCPECGDGLDVPPARIPNLVKVAIQKKKF